MSKGKPSEEPKNKGKVPNAYQINPQMMEGLSQITPENLVVFMMQNPQIVPEKFRKSFWKNVKDLATACGFSAVGGLAANMIVTRAIPRFLILPNYARIPLRFAIFGLPFLIFFPKLNGYYEKANQMVEEQFFNIQKFRKTGNIQEYFK